MKIVQWVLSRVSEPSSYAAVAAGVIGVGILTGFEWLAVIGVGKRLSHKKYNGQGR